ncbi:MAG: divalent cation transporter [Spirochaetes bacterium]|nr:divalent cation transporter [Spirochaetota bacterium]
MNNVLKISLYAYIGGLPIIIGGLLSAFLQSKKIGLKSTINHWFVAFAGGALISAIAFVLVPRSISVFSAPELLVIFLSGTFTFMVIDMLIARVGESLGIVISMMMDFLPEALALGATFALSHKFGLLLAVFIGLQNLPEGFGSYIELTKRMKSRSALLLLFGLSFVGIIAALSGVFFLSNKPAVVDLILLYAGGGIMYLVFQDIAPLSRGKNDWIPATGASIGFVIGMIGEKILL